MLRATSGAALAAARRSAIASSKPALVLLLCAGTTLTIATLGDQSLWFDEFMTFSTGSPGDTLGQVFREQLLADVHPPLYGIFMHLWIGWAGASEAALRFPSLACFIITLGAAFHTERYLTGGRTYLALPALVACTFGATFYAQEARSYALLLLESWLITDLTIRIVDCVTARRPRPELVVFHFVAAILASFTHYFGFLVAAGSFAVILIAATWAGYGAKHASWSAALLAVLFFPWIGYHLAAIRHLTGGMFWIDNDVVGLARGVARLLFGTLPAALAAMALLATVVLGHRILDHRRPGDSKAVPFERLLPLLGIVLFSVAAAAVISLHTPVMTARNLVILLPALLIGLFLTFHGSGFSGRRQVLLSLLVTIFFAGSSTADGEKEDWRLAGATLGRYPACDTAPVLTLRHGTHSSEIYQYYVTNGVRPRFIPTMYGSRKATMHTRGAVDLTAALDSHLPDLTASPCPVMLWAGHVDDDTARAIPGLFRERGVPYRIVHTRGNLLLLKED